MFQPLTTWLVPQESAPTFLEYLISSGMVERVLLLITKDTPLTSLQTF